MRDLLDSLVREGLLADTAAGEVVRRWREGEAVEQAILSADGLTPGQLLPALARHYNVDYRESLDDITPDRALLRMMPAAMLTQHKLFPLSREGETARIATATLFRTHGLDELRLATGLDMVPVLTTQQTIDAALRKHLGVGAATVQSRLADADGVQVVAISALRGVSDVRIPALIAALAYWVVAVPIGYVLAFPMGWQAVGIWIGLAIGLGTAAAALSWRFHRHTRDPK